MLKIWRIVVVILLLGTLLNVGVTVAQEHELIRDSSVTKSPNLFVGANRQSKNATEPAGMSFSPDRDSPRQNRWPEGVPREAYLPLDHYDSSAHSCAPGTCEYVKGRVLIKLASGIQLRRLDSRAEWTEEAGLNRALAGQGVERLERLFPQASSSQRPNDSPLSLDNKGGSKRALADWYVATLADEEADVGAVVQALSQAPNVEYAEPDYVARRAGAPNDPRYAEQWGLEKVQIEAAWDLTAGDPAIVIAIVDSGIDLDHPDLVPNLWTNPGEVAGNGVDDDNNGYVDDVRGWNFVFGSNDVWDDNGHGSLVSGIAAARSGNGIGIAGVCGECRIMPVKVMQPSRVANYSDIAAGIVYATDKGARVINLSLGGYAHSAAVADAVAYATAQNVVLVGGVGNDNTSMPFYPAAYDDVIAMAGTTISDTRTVFTNYGAWVDVSAPGEDILTTALGSDYITTSGTSMAAPFAAGLAGILLSLHPDWTPAMVRSQLMHTADSIDDLNPGYEGQLGSGRINAAQAILPPEPILTYAGYGVNGTPNGRPDFGADATLTVSISDDWDDALDVGGTLATTDPLVTVVTDTASFGDILSGETAANAGPFSITIDTAAGYNHPISFTLALSANSGDYTTTLVFTVTTRSDVEPVAGTIATDTTWTSDKTYLATANVGVASGVTLTIRPGTVVQFEGNYALNVGGTLIADGTSIQPIVFMPSGGGTWNRIFFDDSSTDANVDPGGNYQSGCILRYVQLEGAENGIVSGNAIPYLAYLSSDAGGINCTLGDGSFWLLDSAVTGSVSANGAGHVWRSTISAAGLSLSGASEVLTSTVGGSITLGGGSTVWATTASGGISISGSGTVENSAPDGNISLNSGTVISNVVTGGSISLNSGTVLSNTVQRGGISVGSGSTVQGNNVEDAPGTAIQTSGTVTVIANRVVGSGGIGIVASAGLVQGNLIANCSSDGLRVGAVSVINNTFTGIEGRALYTSGGIPLQIKGNNFEFNPGPYDLYNDNPSGPTSYVIAQRNWWGTTDTEIIAGRIFDFDDDYNKGRVSYTLVLTGPSSDAPAYVRGLTLSPASPVGIQTVAFYVDFSREMDMGGRHTSLAFYTTMRGTWETYNESNSGLANNNVWAIGIDAMGGKWFGIYCEGVSVLHADGTWQTYNPSNSGLASNTTKAVGIDATGGKWFVTSDGVSVLRADGTWQTYNESNSGLADDDVLALGIDAMGGKWFGTGDAGVSVLRADGTWQTYNESNSGLAHNFVQALGIDALAGKWFGTRGGVSVLRADSTWQTYNMSNSGLADDFVITLGIDAAGGKWFGFGHRGGGVSVLRPDGTWQTYNMNNSGLAGNEVHAVGIDAMGGKWFGTTTGGVSVLRADGTWQTYNESNSGLADSWVKAVGIDTVESKWFGTSEGGVSVLYHGEEHSINDNAQWLDGTHHRATYDFTTIVPRGTYSLTVSSAVGTDGIEIAPYSGVTFTVDYAGYIADTTPPDPPSVTAHGDGTTTAISAHWSASDPESAITLYRYAIGTAPGGTNVVNWTNISAAEIERSGLNLLQGETYYVSVKARNEGGLWSEPGVSNGVVAGLAATTSVPLHPGWNLISAPLSPDSTTITEVLSSIEGQYDLVYAYDASDVGDPWKKYNTAAPSFLNDLTEIDETMGLWIRVTEAVTLTIPGSVPSSTDISLYAGWNLVGYPSQTTRPVTEALANIDGSYDLVYAYDASDAADPWKKYNTAAPSFLNDLTEMGPDRGYWMRVSEDCVWTVP